ncbi:MAG: pyruvate formate lyase family protein [Lentisphaeria bacterium]|nr:pyruvate formate lyase family protein [Lentisphaeria bacterium]
MNIYSEGVEILRKGKKEQVVVNNWFYVQEQKMEIIQNLTKDKNFIVNSPLGQARILKELAEVIKLELPAGSVFAGTQDVAFSPSYALINPAFKVESFGGYCDPCAIYDDVVIEGDITVERVEKVRKFYRDDEYASQLFTHYDNYEKAISEVVFFMEPVTGHTIPDVRPFLSNGVLAMQAKCSDSDFGKAMKTALDAVLILGERYCKLAITEAEKATDKNEKIRLTQMAERLERVPAQGAKNLAEAIQMFILLWEVMVLEQAPNPYAFSVGNMDRIFAPYMAGTTFEDAVAYFRHLLAFFIVGSRGWAISQNIMVGGSDEHGNDLSSDATYAVLEAFFISNDPQPALSAKIHKNTPDKFYQELGRFFATPGHSTPSLFNDDSMFEMLRKQGIAESDLAFYSIAGCQEPLIMGKSSLNTTNTWLNLGKILELTLNNGYSLISGKKLAPDFMELGYNSQADVWNNLEEAFWKMLDFFLPQMAAAGNGCTAILGNNKMVPMTSIMHDGLKFDRDMRDPENPGITYNGSGCLIHGLSVVADSFYAVQKALPIFGYEKISAALKADYQGFEEIQEFLQNQDKYGNNIDEVDVIAVRVAEKTAKKVAALKNNAGNNYCADFSTPSTHLLYGYWVGATPDGRNSRKMLGYGIDPRPESCSAPLQSRIISARKLPFYLMNGGYASHIGIPCQGNSLGNAGEWMRDRVIKPLFAITDNSEVPYYVYFNLDSTEYLRKILTNPKLYVPSGVYIMRIHGTFVNFLDLSSAIQEDIIQRLEASAI